MLNDPRFTAEVELTIPFHDVDMMGVAWHGNYFRYFEVAREALLNQFNYGYRQMKESGYLWPVVDARVKYRHALTFEQRIRVRAHIESSKTVCGLAIRFSMPKRANAPPPDTPFRSRSTSKVANCALSAPIFCLNAWESNHEIFTAAGAAD